MGIWPLISPDLRALECRASLIRLPYAGWLPCALPRPLTSGSAPLMWRKWGEMWDGRGKGRRVGGFPSIRERHIFGIWSLLWGGERQPPRSQPHGTVVLWERLRDRAETAQWARMPAGGLLIPKVSPNYRDA